MYTCSYGMHALDLMQSSLISFACGHFAVGRLCCMGLYNVSIYMYRLSSLGKPSSRLNTWMHTLLIRVVVYTWLCCVKSYVYVVHVIARTISEIVRDTKFH